MLGVKIEKEDYSQIYVDLLADSSQDIVILNIEDKKIDEVISIDDLLEGKCRIYLESMDIIKKFWIKLIYTKHGLLLISFQQSNNRCRIRCGNRYFY